MDATYFGNGFITLDIRPARRHREPYLQSRAPKDPATEGQIVQSPDAGERATALTPTPSRPS